MQTNKRRLIHILATLTYLLAASSSSAQTTLDDPEDVSKNLFWKSLYPEGGETLYCSKPFNKKSRLMAPSHVYSLSSIRSHFECGTRRQCIRENEKYRFAASDLHNIYPALSRIALDRRNSHFGKLPAEVAEKFPRLKCNYRSSFQVTEPQDSAKGNVARALFYMEQTYDLPIPMSIPLELLIQWNEIDPPDDKEKARNEQIEAIQGTRNHFIDDPSTIKDVARKM